MLQVDDRQDQEESSPKRKHRELNFEAVTEAEEGEKKPGAQLDGKDAARDMRAARTASAS
jgi:hypothetical protein